MNKEINPYQNHTFIYNLGGKNNGKIYKNHKQDKGRDKDKEG